MNMAADRPRVTEKVMVVVVVVDDVLRSRRGSRGFIKTITVATHSNELIGMVTRCLRVASRDLHFLEIYGA